jgi:excisionase family DNA binding protein
MARPTPAKEYCSTTEAAQRLGLSLGTVQQMVENGVLEGWKTAGGHRRILLASLEEFVARSRTTARAETPQRAPGQRLRVLIAEDDLVLQKLYQHSIEGWNLPIDLRIVSSGFDVLLEIGHATPDLLITDLRMPGLDGFEMIRRIRENRLAADLDIIVVSGLTPEDIEQAGGLPEDVTVFGKPVPMRELNGYARALVARQSRLNRSAG